MDSKGWAMLGDFERLRGRIIKGTVDRLTDFGPAMRSSKDPRPVHPFAAAAGCELTRSRSPSKVFAWHYT